MILAIRKWFIERLLGKDANLQWYVGAACFEAVLDALDTDYVEWNSDATGQVREYAVVAYHETPPVPEHLECDVCRFEFDGNPDYPSRCPNCSSRSVSLVTAD